LISASGRTDGVRHVPNRVYSFGEEKNSNLTEKALNFGNFRSNSSKSKVFKGKYYIHARNQFIFMDN
jgi:hypothetical protein